MNKLEGWRGPVAVASLTAMALGAAGCSSVVGHNVSGEWNVGVTCPTGTRLDIDLINGVSPEGDMGTVDVDCRGSSNTYNSPSSIELLGSGKAPKAADGQEVLRNWLHVQYR